MTIANRTVAYALCASLLAGTALVCAGDPVDATAPRGEDKALGDFCNSTSHSKGKVTRALNKMMDMGETPEAKKLSKEERRDRQFKIFWKELQDESNAG